MAGGEHRNSGQGRVVDGRFELLERLGSGGMGTVWRARDTVLDREVALKEVRPSDPVGDGGDGGDTAARRVRERVLREARALARINHPNVVMVHHIVDARPYPWIVMELLSGPSLQDRLADGPLGPREAARIGREVLAALRAAHAAGIHHRDVKPANVLLRSIPSAGSGPGGREAAPGAVLTDFGIAALQGSTSLTATGEIVGSPEYIAPERIRGVDDDPASDLWSLAMTLYVCTEGRSPLRRATALATLAAVLDDPVPPPVRSGALAPALTAMLVRDPAARPDAERFDALLADAEAGRVAEHLQATRTALRPPAAPPPPPPSSPPPPPTRLDTPNLLGSVPPGGTATVTTAPDRSARRRGRTASAVAAAAVAATLVAVSAYSLATRSGDSGEDRSGGGVAPSATAPPSASPSVSPAVSASGSPSPPPSPDEAEETDGETRESPGNPSQGAPGTPAPPDTAPMVPGEESADTWIAQLFSEPVSSGTATRDRRLAAVRAQVPEARMLRSDDFASLRPGYWVIYAPGPFADGRAAVRYCAERGRTTANTCVGRFLSHRADDRVYVCHPASGGSGRCTRS